MKKKSQGILFVLVAIVIVCVTMMALKDGLSEKHLYFAIFLVPFSWIATIVYCKFFTPNVKKRVAALTIFSFFFVATIFYSFVQYKMEQTNNAGIQHKCGESRVIGSTTCSIRAY